LLLCSLLLTGCAAGEEVPATVPAETTEPTVSAPVVEIAATEATQPQEDDRIWHGLYWMEGEDKPHLRCMITNETDYVMRVESISAVYYQNGDIVREDASSTLANMEKMDQSLSYLDSVCLWVTNDLSLEEYDQALCTVMLHGDSGEETTQEFWFTTDETKVTHADPFAGKDFSYATLDNNNWGFWYFPENNTGEELSLEGWY